MDYILQVLSVLTQNSDYVRWLFIGTIAITALIIAFGLIVITADLVDPFRRRLGQILGHQQTPDWSAERWTTILKTFASATLPKKNWDQNKASVKLINAGFRSPEALTVFYAIRTLAMLLFMIIAILVAPFIPRLSSPLMVVALAVYAGFIGLMLPKIILNHLIKKRKRLIMNGFPDALDLLVVCTEAGLGLNAALERVADELIVSHPDLANELAVVNGEIRAGVERTTALRNLAKRTDLPEIGGLVSVLSQTMRFGTSIADTLRIYSEEYRDKRMQKAEEQAAKLAVKMIIPIVICIMPAFLIVILGPSILGLLAAFQGQASG